MEQRHHWKTISSSRPALSIGRRWRQALQCLLPIVADSTRQSVARFRLPLSTTNIEQRLWMRTGTGAGAAWPVPGNLAYRGSGLARNPSSDLLDGIPIGASPARRAQSGTIVFSNTALDFHFQPSVQPDAGSPRGMEALDNQQQIRGNEPGP
jgi:hypothetical protein